MGRYAVALALGWMFAAGCTGNGTDLADVVVNFRLTEVFDIGAGSLTFNVFDEGDYSAPVYTNTYAYSNYDSRPLNSEVFQLAPGTYDLAGVMEDDPPGSGDFIATAWMPGQTVVDGSNQLALYFEVIAPNELNQVDFGLRQGPKIVSVTSDVDSVNCFGGGAPGTISIEVSDFDSGSYHAYLYGHGGFTDLGPQTPGVTLDVNVQLDAALGGFDKTIFAAIDGDPNTYHGADVEFGMNCAGATNNGTFTVVEDGYQPKYLRAETDHIAVVRQSDTDVLFYCDSDLDGSPDANLPIPAVNVLGVKWEPDASAGRDLYTLYLLANGSDGGAAPDSNGIPSDVQSFPCGPP